MIANTTRLLAFAILLAACGDGGSTSHPDVTAGDTSDATVGDTTDVTTGDVDTTPSDVTSEDSRDATDAIDATDATTPVDSTVGDGDATTTACDFAPDPTDNGFDDHTVQRFASADCFFQYAGTSTHDPVLVKFAIVGFLGDAPSIRFYENGFYQLHDEWYWFRLLNGHSVPDLDDVPIPGLSFPTIGSIYEAYASSTELPLDLTRYDDRLYSPRFYDLAGFPSSTATPPPRVFGVGSIAHYDADPARQYPSEIWSFELEYLEQPTADTINRYFQDLTRLLPPDIAQRLLWIARSPAQVSVAQQMIAAGGPLAHRILTYPDLVVAGAVSAYNPGVTAGYPHVLDESWSPSDVQPDEIVVLPLVPDDVPACRGIISAVPQTALAHVNLLAKSRGTPNAYVAGILGWGQLGDWSYTHTPVILDVTGDQENGQVRWVPLTQADYGAYLDRLQLPARHVATPPDLTTAPYTISLTQGGAADMAGITPLVGGKCAGFLSFLDVPTMVTPPSPMCITIRAYHEHMASLEPTFRALVADATFVADARVRLLALEGQDSFEEANANDPAALAWETGYLAAHTTDVVGQVIKAGGAKEMVRKKPMDPTTLATIRAVVEQNFAFLAPTQGLRFRKPSTSEDIVGFNGAGLYDSNTGFLFPAQAPHDEQNQSIEWAIKKTWSSYWLYGAFEARRLLGIDHFEGNMGVAIHPRFDDDYELANGVVTHYYSAYNDPPTHHFIINIQAGSTAVTNPGGTSALPEIDEVDQTGDGPITIQRVAGSTLVAPGTLLITDDELRALYAQSSAHLANWLAVTNARVTAAEQNQTLVLDYEMKRMGTGWPALTSGAITPEHLLWRQSRTLDSDELVRQTDDPWLTPETVAAAFPITQFLPHDLRTVADRIVAADCSSDLFDIRTYELFTTVSTASEFPFVTTPYVYKTYIAYKGSAPGFTWPTVGYWVSRNLLTEASDDPAVGVQLSLSSSIAATLGTDTIAIDPSGNYRITRGAAVATGTCTRAQKLGFSSPTAFLKSLLP